RTIDHELEKRGIKTLFYICEADLYLIEAGYQSSPAPTPVILHYTLDDIEQLDREAREGDNLYSGVKDFLSLSQILRAISTYVGRKRARLLSVSNNALRAETMPVVTIEYETAEGERVIDDRTASAIYDMCVRTYKLRERLNADPVSP